MIWQRWFLHLSLTLLLGLPPWAPITPARAHPAAHASRAVRTPHTAFTDLSLNLSGPNTAPTGGLLVYTLTVTNEGPTPVGVVFTNTVTDPSFIGIPDGTTLVTSLFVPADWPPVLSATLTLNNLQHNYLEDLDILLLAPEGQYTMLMSDGAEEATQGTLSPVFADAGTQFPCLSGDPPLSTGPYHPRNCSEMTGDDNLPSPAPPEPMPGYPAAMSAFVGANPNGSWQLLVRDDQFGNNGSMTGGWTLALAGLYPGPVLVTNTLPSGAVYQSASGVGWACTPSGNQVVCSRPGLAVETAPPIYITATAPLTPGFVTNSAVVASPVQELNANNNTDQVFTSLIEISADLAVTQSDSPDPVLVNNPLTYYITATNNGPATSNQVILTDTLPNGVTFNWASGNCSWNGTEVVCYLGPLGPGNWSTATIIVVPTVGGSLNNTVLVADNSGNTFDPVDSNNTTTIATFVRQYGSSLTPSSAAQTGPPGGTVTYTLRLTNTGNSVDTFNLSESNNAYPVTRPLSVGPLNPGQGVNFNVVVSIPPGTPAGANDTVFIQAISQGNPNTSTSASLTTQVSTFGAVALTPASGVQIGYLNRTVTYTLRVTNTGNVPYTFNVTKSGNTFTTTHPATVGPLNGGAGATLNVVVTIPNNVPSGQRDVVTLTVTSQTSATVTARAVLTTTALGLKVYLPFVRTSYPFVALPITQNFEGSAPACPLPAGWSVQSTTSSTWEISAINALGACSARVVWQAAPQNEVLFSPYFAVAPSSVTFATKGSPNYCGTGAGGACDLKVWLVRGAWNNGGDDVLLGYAESAWASEFGWVTPTWPLTASLNNLPGRIAFQYTGSNGANAYVDNISINP